MQEEALKGVAGVPHTLLWVGSYSSAASDALLELDHALDLLLDHP